MKTSSVTRSYPHISILEVWSWLLENSRRRCMTNEVSTNKQTHKQMKNSDRVWQLAKSGQIKIDKDWFVRTNRKKIRHEKMSNLLIKVHSPCPHSCLGNLESPWKSKGNYAMILAWSLGNLESPLIKLESPWKSKGNYDMILPWSFLVGFQAKWA